MFSTVGSIFTKKPRHAEKTDTRQAIRRQEREQNRDSSASSEGESSLSFNEDDNAMVSIGALRLFLQNLIKAADPETENTLNIDDGDSARAIEQLDSPASSINQSSEEPEALKDLRSALETNPDASLKQGRTKRNNASQTTDHKKACRAADAARAYEHSAETKPNNPDTEYHTSQSTSDMIDALEVSPAEIRIIHTVLNNLKTLADRQVEYLRIEHGESFLDSLVSAVEKALVD